MAGLVSSSPALAAWPPLSDAAPSAGGGSRDAALIVAIQDYAFVPDIPGARANGNAWLTWLTKCRGVKARNVRTLWDADATAEVIERKAREAAALVGSGGTLGSCSPGMEHRLAVGTTACWWRWTLSSRCKASTAAAWPRRSWRRRWPGVRSTRCC